MRKAFTLIELLVVISIIALLIAILLPALGAARRSARQMQNSTQLRGIHQGMFSFAQENKGWFPGLKSDGVPYEGGGTIAHVNTAGSTYRSAGFGVNHSRRAAILFELEIFPPEYLISPGDSNKSVPDTSVAVGSENVGPDNHSYATISINLLGQTSTQWSASVPPPTWVPSDRALEWRDTANAQAVVFSDRAIADAGTAGNLPNAAATNFHSIWTEPGSGTWTGSVLNNDGSANFNNTPIIDTTRYAAGPTNRDDHLFHDNRTGTLNANARLSHVNATATLSPD